MASPRCTGNPCTCLRGVPDRVLTAVRASAAPSRTERGGCDCDSCAEQRAREKATEDWRNLNEALRMAEQLRAHPDGTS